MAVVHRAEIRLERRSLWGRITRSPWLWFRHYRVMRQGNGRIVSAYAAWLLASKVIKFRPLDA